MSSQATTTAARPRFGPAPAGFVMTPKSLEAVPFLLEEHPEVYEQVSSLLLAAENELFVPLFGQAQVTEFTQQFEFLANRYFPIRLQILLNLVNAIGLETFRADYFQQIPQLLIALTHNSEHWGLNPAEVATSFEQYFECGQRIISIAPHIQFAPAEPLLHLLTSITEMDFGFTALGLVFEGTIEPVRWTVPEVFKLTRRSLLVYQDATNALVAGVESMRPGQTKIDFDAAYHSAVVDIATYRPEPDDPPVSDKRSTFRTYKLVK